ncbi:hypothetical protein DFH08DRAFT_364859 [Mycena albidolilacea]|uniref:Uncharacterized protein n=1 Tax=Mycena albidolilacea TaxID=1033008 RepID=A0AAD7F282_9AGAR|nr:hypothetical protein DFH08DRAFT_364859 [Mycena albidolilacea]
MLLDDAMKASIRGHSHLRPATNFPLTEVAKIATASSICIRRGWRSSHPNTYAPACLSRAVHYTLKCDPRQSGVLSCIHLPNSYHIRWPLSLPMAEATIYIPLFLAIFVQRSVCLSWAAEPSDTESLADQTYDSLEIMPLSTSSNVSILPIVPAATGLPVGGQGSISYSGGDGQSVWASVPYTVTRAAPGGGIATTTEFVLTGTQTFTAIFITDTLQPSVSASIPVIIPPANPSTSSAATISVATSVASISPQGAPQIFQLPSTPLTSLQSPTSTFGNDIHVSATLSPSTSIFTASTSYSLFTQNGHITSTAIPILSTSVTLVPVPTHTSAQTASKSSGPSTSVAVGIALGGVAVFLGLVLLFIINRRRNLRRRAFLRLGEEF